MTKTWKFICALIIVVFAAALLGMAATSDNRRAEESNWNGNGGVEKVLADINKSGVNATAVSFADIYGKDYVYAVPLCPGDNKDVLNQIAPGDYDQDIKFPVPRGTNYLVLLKKDGYAADAIPTKQVDLCSSQAPAFKARSLTAFAKTQDGKWSLVG